MKDNKWLHGPTNFELPDIEIEFGLGPHDGIFPFPLIMEGGAGEEVVLFLRDQTPFMQGLKRVTPFQLFVKAGAGRNHWGPVPFLLFYIPNPANDSEPFYVYDSYMNLSNPQHLNEWRSLANQSHWHLFLVGAGNQQEGFFEFENNFSLGDSLDSIQSACANIQMIDFDRAKAEFMKEHEVMDLFRM